MSIWHIITSEYPPQPGGVSDYTRIVARELAAAGDDVHVWCPQVVGATPQESRVIVQRDLGNLGPSDLWRVSQRLKQFAAPRRLLVQWVPHGYGYRSMNVPFCLWLLSRAKLHGDRVEVMFHEPFFAFTRQFWKHNAAAIVHRLMTMMLLQAAQHAWVSIPAWEPMLRPYALGRSVPFAWLPVPSNIAAADDPASISAIHACYTPPGGLLVGHFGTYGQSIKETLMAVLPALLSGEEKLGLLLLGRGSEALCEDLVRQHPNLVARLHALSGLAAADVARHISACDLMLQPYPDGISARRTSAMASLANGRPVITTTGRFTEPLWAASGAVALTPDGDAAAMTIAAERLLNDAAARQRLSAAAHTLYQARFNIRHVVAALRTQTTNGTGDEHPWPMPAHGINGGVTDADSDHQLEPAQSRRG